MRRINLKVGGVIVLFSVVLSVIFIIVFLWFRWTTSNTIQTTNSYIEGVIVSPNIESKPVGFKPDVPNITPDFQVHNIISPDIFSDFYSEQIFRQLTFTMATLCTIIFLSSFVLWRILLSMQRKSDMQLVRKLQTITDEAGYASIDPAFSAVYQKLKQKFFDHITDYKRLHTYLSHEQKNNIAILRTGLELAENMEQLKIIDRISNSIDDILTLSESSEDTKKICVDVTLICAEVCDAYSNLSNKINFSFDEADHVILAKNRWIYRAVSNLVDNAVKYGNGESIEVSVESKNHSIIVSVKDYGIGIDESVQEAIFDHRFRINELQKDGYGIGLSLVSHVCDLCGGFVFVESKENIGSTFYLSFPEVSAGVNIR